MSVATGLSVVLTAAANVDTIELLSQKAEMMKVPDVPEVYLIEGETETQYDLYLMLRSNALLRRFWKPVEYKRWRQVRIDRARYARDNGYSYIYSTGDSEPEQMHVQHDHGWFASAVGPVLVCVDQQNFMDQEKWTDRRRPEYTGELTIPSYDRMWGKR